MSSDVNKERGLALTPNTFAFILDKTQGEVQCHVGPAKVTIGDDDQPVVFNNSTKRFDECTLSESVQSLVIAPEGWYLTLKNPSFKEPGVLRVPQKGKNLSQDANLTIGRKVNIPGPVSMPLWPGQMVQVVPGHNLRSNQYLRARVYDEEAACENREEAIIKASDVVVDGDGKDSRTTETSEKTEVVKTLIPKNLTIGQQFNIKGTDVSFFIPPTGIEIVREDGEFIRDAETLEVLEYCILLDEDGNKSFVYGPKVVFPDPTQDFITKSREGVEVRKFLAFELNENMGLYIKVIKDYVEEQGTQRSAIDDMFIKEDGDNRTAGDELFVTGKTNPVYYPREEHAIVQYDKKKKINYSVAVPPGEGRYVLNRRTGEVSTHTGPSMLLPDPRLNIIVRRVLKDRDVELMYPGNTQALEINRQLDALRTAAGEDFVAYNSLAMGDAFAVDTQSARSVFGQKHASGPKTRSANRKAMKNFAGDEVQRSDTFTPPRTITLDNKYDGVVTVNVWTGYAVNIINKSGDRRVVVGPKTVMLDYDESLEPFSLSRGCPKDKRNKKDGVYLRVLNNRVTDRIDLQTKDLVDVSVVLSYRVNFTGDESVWFNVEDYVGLLTDHMRSVLRNKVQRHSIEEFWGNKIDIVRDCILGAQADGEREGRLFKQNGMQIYDLDFIESTIHDTEIAGLLVNAQHDSVRLHLDLERQKRDQDAFTEVEHLKRERAEVVQTTSVLTNKHNLADIERAAAVNTRRISVDNSAEELRLGSKLNNQTFLDDIQVRELDRSDKQQELTDKFARQAQSLRLAEFAAKRDAEIARIKAVTPDLIAAMQSLGHSELVERVTSNLSPLAILGGESVADVGRKLLTGTGLESIIEALPNVISKSNGDTRLRS